VAHGGVQHGGDEAALHHVHRVTEVGADIEFKGAGACFHVRIYDAASQHADKPRLAGVEFRKKFLFFHSDVPRVKGTDSAVFAAWTQRLFQKEGAKAAGTARITLVTFTVLLAIPASFCCHLLTALFRFSSTGHTSSGN